MRIVLDANQFVSAVLVPTGRPAQVLECWRVGDLELAVSEDILEEVRRVLLYPRLQKRHRWNAHQIDVFLTKIASSAIATEGTAVVPPVPDDPTDTKYLVCAIESAPEYIITGDQHLLRMDPWRNVRILNPATFIEDVLGQG